MSFANELNMDFAIQPNRTIDICFWEEVNSAKKLFLDSNSDLRDFPCIIPEVAESWIRSRAYGINPHARGFNVLTHQKLKALIKSKESLINTTSNFIKNFVPLLTVSQYIITLLDENGTVLLIEGEKQEVESFEKIGVVQGTVMAEKVVGTTAHALSIHHKAPVQIIGPYNYLMLLQDNISSSAPIFDEDGNVIGSLAVVQMLGKNNLSSTQVHSLGWVTSMAYAIERNLRIKKQNSRLLLMNATLEATLSVIDEGFITLDKEGLISHANKEGARILTGESGDLIGRHCSDFLKKEHTSMIARVLKDGKALEDIETSIADGSDELYLMSIQPVWDFDEDNNKPQGVVIHLTHIDRINKLVTSRSGSEARFTFDNIMGKSPALMKSIDIAKQVGSIPNVLLIGESGTGKELFAQSIHNQYRLGGPFVAINCAALPRNLIESELFGYEGGTFTGAERKGRPGKIELANGGTLFLDEIGDMPLEIQPILLRVLEDKKVMRLGGNRHISVDFRLIAATNQDLYQMVRNKTFREDLYFRLSIFKIKIPPLRERGEDILLLAEYFIKSMCEKTNRMAATMSPEARKKIREYSWPGNIRQLENAMVYAVSMARDGIIRPNNLPDELLGLDIMDKKNNALMPLKELENMAIREALAQTGNDISDAAKILGMSRTTLYRKLKELSVST